MFWGLIFSIWVIVIASYSYICFCLFIYQLHVLQVVQKEGAFEFVTPYGNHRVTTIKMYLSVSPFVGIIHLQA